MPSTQLTSILETNFRANPEYELVQFDRLPEAQKQLLSDLQKDPDEFTDIAAKQPEVVARLQKLMFDRFRATHPDAPQLPKGLDDRESIEWFLRPRDA